MGSKTAYPELCAKCGAWLSKDPLRPARLCPRHLDEARIAADPIACTSADIDAGYPEDDAPRQDKGILECVECTRETTCSLCGSRMSPGEWTVKLHGRDTKPSCAGDDGWRIK
jgi:hypothetical protein